MQIRGRKYPLGCPDRPGAGEVHVWVACLENPPRSVEELREALTLEERDRGERYRQPAIRDQFLRTRGLLRVLLGSYLGIRPERVSLTVDVDGKPRLEAGGVKFNVSHSQGVAAFVVAECEVGIDIEMSRDIGSADGLVERFFHPVECQRYFALPQALRSNAFLRAWTCKEAVLKGIGCGARGLDRCEVEVDPRLPPRVIRLPVASGTWSLNCWEPVAGFVGAVAVRSESATQLIRE